MGNNNSIGNQDIIPEAKRKVKRTSSALSNMSTILKCKTADQSIKLYKTFETINIFTNDEWQASNNFKENELYFKNVNKIFSCKGKSKETCTNGFCLYSVNIQTHKKLLSNHKFNYYTKNYKLRFRLRDFFHIKKKKYTINTEAKKIMDHMKYNHLPAMFSSFHHYNVKGLIKGNFNDYVNETNNSLLLINIYSEITEKTRFVLINLKTTKFLTIFGDYHGYINANDVFCSWSPDLTKLLLRINNNLNNDNDVLTALPENIPPGSISFIDYYDISKRDGKLIKRLKYFHKQVIFTFDPTCNYSRIAITDYYQETSNSMYIIDLNSINCEKDNKAIKLLSCSQSILPDLSRNACDIKFSLDGSYIIVTIGDNICCCSALPNALSEIKYLIFDAYSCQLLKYYSSYLATCTIHMCPLTYLPKISTCQTRMALPKKYLSAINSVSIRSDENHDDWLYYNAAIRRYSHNLSYLSRRNKNLTTNQTKKFLCNFPFLSCSANELNSSNVSTFNTIDLSFVKIIQMPCSINLKNFCRIVIIRNIKTINLIDDLQLPEKLKAYLLFKPQNN